MADTHEDGRAAVLVVDDDRGVREVLARYVEREGHPVVTAATLREARAVLASREILAVLCDITMPDGDNGLDLLSEVRAGRPDLDVLMITGNPDTDSAIEALRRGANDYIRKPFRPDELREALRRAVERRRSTSQDTPREDAPREDAAPRPPATTEDRPRIFLSTAAPSASVDGQAAARDARAQAVRPARDRTGEGAAAMLRVEGLTKRYGKRTVVDDVGYAVHPGEIVGLLGPNGAGKTTTFRMTIGMITPDAGRIVLTDTDVTDQPMFRRARLGMGYLSQEPSIFRHLSVRENLLAVLEALGMPRADRRERTAELIEEFGLQLVADESAVTLSGGERRRLELARTLALDPSLILLDEPFSGVDPIAVEDIQRQLVRLRDRGIAVLITDHSVRETLGTTDRAYIIYEGAIFRHGTAHELAADPRVRAVYLGERFTMPEAERTPR